MYAPYMFVGLSCKFSVFPVFPMFPVDKLSRSALDFCKKKLIIDTIQRHAQEITRGTKKKKSKK